jgi:hypothetical protein
VVPAAYAHRIRLALHLHQPPRRVDLPSYQDTVLVCAVVTILIIRLQLAITNYPQLGGGKLHIAHLLWGGFLMLVAIGLVLSYYGPRVRRAGAVLGGVGFGFFIDELGKFITSDNDYFFKPAAGVIYVVFILLYFLTRWLRRRADLTPREALVNAADLIQEAALHDFDAREQRRTLDLLDRADPSDPLVAPLRRLVLELHSMPARPPGLITRIARWIRGHYYELIQLRWFPRVVRIVFTVLGVVSVVQVLALVFNIFVVEHNGKVQVTVTAVFDRVGDLSFISWANIVSALVAAVLLWIGIVRIRHSRLEGYHWFERSLLVSICLTQVFVFVESQFAAVFGLSVEVILYITVRSMIRAEVKLAHQREIEAGLPAAAPPMPAPPPAPKAAAPG